MEPQHDSAQRLYDARAHKYDNSCHPSFAKLVAQISNLKPGDKVLDLACGTGLVTFNAATAVGPEGHVTAVDISTGMLEQARSKQKAQNVSNVDFYQHDITGLDSLDAVHGQSFDVITLASALVLLDDPKLAIQHWAKFLKPGGCLVVDVPSPHNLVTGLLFERTGKQLGVKIPFYRDWVRSSESIKELLEEAGLVVEKVDAVEQTGAGVDYLSIADAERLFDQEIGYEAYKSLAADGVKGEAKIAFKEECEKIAVDGRIKREDLVWVAVGRRDAGEGLS